MIIWTGVLHDKDEPYDLFLLVTQALPRGNVCALIKHNAHPGVKQFPFIVFDGVKNGAVDFSGSRMCPVCPDTHTHTYRSTERES